MFCLRNQDITDAKAFFYLFFMSNSGYLTRIQCLVSFYFICVIAKPSSIHISIKIIQDRAEITATIKLDDKKHLNISRKRSVIYL